MLDAWIVVILTQSFVYVARPCTNYLEHFSSAFVALGGSAAAVFDDWSRLNRLFTRDASLRALPLEEAYSRALLHFKDNHFNLLLLAALVQAKAMDVVLAECGAARLLPSLKREEAGRRGNMLLFLVGHAWLTIKKQDPSLINAVGLVNKWIEMSG